MTAPVKTPFNVPADIAERSRLANGAIERGQPMTFQNLADALGLPFEFVAACVGLTEALQSGQTVIIDPKQLKVQ